MVPNGAEFTTGSNLYYFPQNAYSTTDWLLDRIYNKDPLCKVAPTCQVSRLELNKEGNKVSKLHIIDAHGNTRKILANDRNVILCAGTVNTAAIALQSGKLGKNHHLVGQGLTDHEIWMAKYSMEIAEEKAEEEQPVELSCHVKIHGHEALLTLCTPAERFYGHGFTNGDEFVAKEAVNVLNIMLEFEAPLNEKGRVCKEFDDYGNPFIEINRTRMDSDPEFEAEMKNLLKKIREAFGFSGPDKPRLAPWGSVAHEVGTMRMDGPDTEGVVDANLKVRGIENLYVCDLSVFPFSPMANPSRTLTALAMRLGDHLSE